MSTVINPETGRLDAVGVRFVQLQITPTSATIGYPIGTEILNTITSKFYKLKSIVGGAASWEELGAGSVAFEDSVLSIADASSAPPTEVLDDRYILSTDTPVHAAWDGAQVNSIVQFDGASWIETIPAAGTFAYVDDVSTLYIFDGVWQPVSSSIPDATTTSKGIASFPAADFTVSSGAVSLIDSVVKTLTTDSGALTPSSHGFSLLGGEGMNVEHTGVVVTISAELATAAANVGASNLGACSFLDSDLSVTSGFVSLVDTVVKSVTTDSGAMTPASHAFSILGGEGMDVTHSSQTITIAGEDASTTNKGIVELDTDAEAQLLADTSRAITASNIRAIFAPQKNSGFQEWTGAGSYYTVTNEDFTLDRPGIGWVNNAQVTWAGGQTEAALSAGNTHYIYIDSAGTIGSSTTRNNALFQDNIVLFEVLVDSAGTANVIVVKENHHITTNPAVMNALHHVGIKGFDVEPPTGGIISVHGTLAVQITGNTDWHDHELETLISDSAAAAIDMCVSYTNGAGKWIVPTAQNTLPTEYNNAGTPTALAGNERSIYGIYASKDDLESATPNYIAIMNNAKFSNISSATIAGAAGNYAIPTSELAALELVQMGYVIINATTIDSVVSEKQTIGSGTVTTTGSSAATISTDTSSFNGILSAADTTVQAALNTIDNMGDPVTVAHGGTASTTATGAFDNLSPVTTEGDMIYRDASNNVRLAKGTAAQILTMNAGATAPEWQTAGTYSLPADLQSITDNTGTAADKAIYYTATNVAAEFDLTAAGRAILDDVDASAQRSTLGLGTIATQAANNVAITGGTITGITSIAIADGGTAAGTATGAFDNLSPVTIEGDMIYRNATNNVRLAKGTANQLLAMNAGETAPEWIAPYSYSLPTNLQSISDNTGTAADKAIYYTATNIAAEFDLTAAGRAILDDIDNTAQRATLGLGTIATQAANNVAITGGTITGITDLVVADGGTGTGTFTDHGLLVGSGTDPITALAVGTNGQVCLGSTGADPIFGTIGSSDSTITWTLGAGTLTAQVRAGNESQTGALELATGVETTTATSTSLAVHPDGLNTRLGTQTDHGIILATGGAGNNLGVSAVGTNGQIFVGSTGADPAWETLTSSDSTISFTTGAGTLSIQARAGSESQTGALELATGVETTTATSTALAVHPDGLDTRLGTQTQHGVMLGGGGAGFNLAATANGTNGQVLTANTGSAPTWQPPASSGFTWSVVTSETKAADIDNGYMCNRGAGVTVTLPDTAAVGDIIEIVGMDGNWTIAQNAGETIHFGTLSTTTGVGGSLTATANGDCVKLICSVANTDWIVKSSLGLDITVA